MATTETLDLAEPFNTQELGAARPNGINLEEVLDILVPGVFSVDGKVVHLESKSSLNNGLSFLNTIYSSKYFNEYPYANDGKGLGKRYECLKDNIRGYYDALFESDKSDSVKHMFEMEMFVLDTMIGARTVFNTAIDAMNYRDALNRLGISLRQQIDSGDFEGLSEDELRTMKCNHFDRQTSADILLEEKLNDLPSSDLKHAPAYIFVLGFDYSSPIHKNRINSFGKMLSRPRPIYSADSRDMLRRIAYEDGAVLINPSMEIIATNANLDNRSLPLLIERNMNIFGYQHSEEREDLDKIGFIDPNVSTRNFNSLAASYSMANTIVYTLSEETGNIRRMKNGLITHSTVQDESVILRLKGMYLHLASENAK